MIFFMNANEEFQRWLQSHDHGYVVACDRWPKPHSQMRLHKKGCQDEPMMQSGIYSKVWSADKDELAKWAKDDVKTTLQVCKHCKP